jgi:hypothetical protein
MWPFGLLQRDSEVRRLWKDAFDAYFPTAVDRANAAFVEVDIERMELWIRGAVVKARMRSSSVVKVEIPVLVGNLIRVAVDRESGDAVV